MGEKLTIGEIIEKVMRDRNWSCAGVGRSIGVPQSTIQGWKEGYIPRADNLANLLAVAGMTLADVDFISSNGKKQHDKVDK